MKLCRFAPDRIGVVCGGEVRDVTDVLDSLPACRYPFPRENRFIAQLERLRPELETAAALAPARKLESVHLLSPVANPGKIVAAPVNYKKHLEEARADEQIHHQNQIAEIQRVGLFLKATSSLIGPSEPILVRHSDRRTDHEMNLWL